MGYFLKRKVCFFCVGNRTKFRVIGCGGGEATLHFLSKALKYEFEWGFLRGYLSWVSGDTLNLPKLLSTFSVTIMSSDVKENPIGIAFYVSIRQTPKI